MKFEFYFGDLKPTLIVQQDVEDLMLESFERYSRYIRAVNVVVTDVNGPKGGVDKACRCVVHLKRMSPIVIQDCDSSFVNLLSRVASRAALNLSQKVERKQTSHRSRRSPIPPEDAPIVNPIDMGGSPLDTQLVAED